MISDKDHFVLLKTLAGIREEVHKPNCYGNDDLKDMRNAFLGFIQGLVDMVQEPPSEEELTA